MIPEPPALQKAAARGDLQTLTALLNDGVAVDSMPTNGFTALAYAAQSGRIEAIHLLLGRGADVNARGGLGRHVLLIATWEEAEHGIRGVVRALLSAGADVNMRSSWGETALQGASSFPSGLDTVRLLLARGADVGIPNRHGWTPLMQATLIGQAEIVHALLAHKPDINVKNRDGLTARMIAAHSHHTDIVRALAEAGSKE